MGSNPSYGHCYDLASMSRADMLAHARYLLGAVPNRELSDTACSYLISQLAAGDLGGILRYLAIGTGILYENSVSALTEFE